MQIVFPLDQFISWLKNMLELWSCFGINVANYLEGHFRQWPSQSSGHFTNHHF